jgi:hypothetical protein
MNPNNVRLRVIHSELHQMFAEAMSYARRLIHPENEVAYKVKALRIGQ